MSEGASSQSKISNKSSFGSSDKGDAGSSERIMVTSSTTSLIERGAYSCL